ncbi:MAG: tRNA pseudouridine(38-40) synthase TruA [Clostridiales bacterium]|nr:tRNA pseudouridine(38-40) synthase TruA [Clostridiales bacterium]
MSEKKRIKLEVAYDGTNYHGWQIQPRAITIEGVLNKHLSELLMEDINIIGASRTDAGVHAYGNVAVFDTSSRIPSEKIGLALNTRLPEDIRIQSSKEVPGDFHPRHCDSVKTYEYHILNTDIPIPTERLYSYFFYRNLDIKKMQEAAGYLVGEHDFKSFCSAKTQVTETVRTIYQLDVFREGNLVKIRISGSGFLYNMVRIIAGTLLQVGIGYYQPEAVKIMLEKKDRTVAGPCAPAKGLRLVNIYYPDLEESKN